MASVRILPALDELGAEEYWRLQELGEFDTTTSGGRFAGGVAEYEAVRPHR